MCRLLLVVLIWALSACGGDGAPQPPVLQRIAVTAARTSNPAGLSEPLTATGSYSDGTSQLITAGVNWTSSDAAVVSVSSSGLATGHRPGSATLTAAVGNVSGFINITVTAAVLQGIAITPSNPVVIAGSTLQLGVKGLYTDGSQAVVPAGITWVATLVPGTFTKASVDSSGLVTGHYAGFTQEITAYASLPGVPSAVTNVTVVSAYSVHPYDGTYTCSVFASDITFNLGVYAGPNKWTVWTIDEGSGAVTGGISPSALVPPTIYTGFFTVDAAGVARGSGTVLGNPAQPWSCLRH
jgi:hypothetical protein